MASIESTCRNYQDFADLLFKFLAGWGTAETLSVNLTGGATFTHRTHDDYWLAEQVGVTGQLKTEDWTITKIQDVGGAPESQWSVVGNLTGATDIALTSQTYDNGHITFLIQDANDDAVVGDSFVIRCTQGAMKSENQHWTLIGDLGLPDFMALENKYRTLRINDVSDGLCYVSIRPVPSNVEGQVEITAGQGYVSGNNPPLSNASPSVYTGGALGGMDYKISANGRACSYIIKEQGGFGYAYAGYFGLLSGDTRDVSEEPRLLLYGATGDRNKDYGSAWLLDGYRVVEDGGNVPCCALLPNGYWTTNISMYPMCHDEDNATLGRLYSLPRAPNDDGTLNLFSVYALYEGEAIIGKLVDTYAVYDNPYDFPQLNYGDYVEDTATSKRYVVAPHRNSESKQIPWVGIKVG